MKIKQITVTILSLIMVAGCNNSATNQLSDTPTTGSISIGIDETFEPIGASEINVFEGIYNYAKIKPYYASESETFNSLLNDSVRLIIASRQLTTKEKEYFQSKKLFPRETLIAYDAVSLIVNQNNQDTLLSIKNLKDIVTGKITSWKQINKKSKLDKIQVVFDNQGSSTVRYIKDSIARSEKMTGNITAAKNNKSVVDFVSKNPNSIGIIGVSWISDRDDTTCLNFLKKIRVVALSRDDVAIPENSYKPYQAYMSQLKYPLIRYIYIINMEPRQGLASGFAAFVASDRGQRIILKFGILPATQPIRIIEVRDNI